MRPTVKPWITPTATERHAGAFMFDGQRIFFPASTGVEEHRELGVLWQPTPPDSGGPVWWSEMHTGRQREAMLNQLCQVCGEKLSSPTNWLLPGIEVRAVNPRGRPFETTTPPTCDDCVDVALANCPNLRANPPMRLTVNHYRPIGVWGDYVAPDGRLVQGQLPLGHDLLPRMMARHLIVQVYDYRRLNVRQGGPTGLPSAHD